MKKNKRFKVIASILIVTITVLIVSPAEFKENLKKLIRNTFIATAVKNEEKSITALGQFQSDINTEKEELSKAIEAKDVDSCKEVVERIIDIINTKDEEIQKEFAKSEEVVEEANYEEAKVRLDDIKSKYNDILASKEKLESALASNTIDEYISILDNKDIFEEEDKKTTTLSTELPHNTKATEVEEVNLENVPSYLNEYPIDNDSEVNEYLEETIETIQTDAIKAKAQELGNNPIDIYEYVRNNINYQPYAGSRKGATGTLQEYAGNDYDISSLLIALLRNANIPARYVSGQVELTPEKAMAWTGTNNIEAAVKILASAGNPTTSIVDGGKIVAVRVNHVWVEAYCSLNEYRGLGNENGEKQWIPFDASYKEYKKVDGINFKEKSNITDEDLEDIFLYSQKTSDGLGIRRIYTGDLDWLLNETKTNIQSNISEDDIIGKRGLDIIGGLDIIEENIDMLPLSIPNKVVKIDEKSSEIDDKERDYISLNLIDNIGLFGEVALRKSAVELYGKKITLSWIPASSEDEEIIKKYGGDIFSVPAYLLEVKPVIRIDGEIVAEGSAIGFGEDENLSITMERVGFSRDRFDNVLTAGGYYALGLDYGCISTEELKDIQQRAIVAKKNISTMEYYSDSILGEIVYGTVKNYFAQVDGVNKILSQEYNIRDTRLLSFGISGVNPKISTVVNKPVDVKLSSLYLDIDNDAHVIISNENAEEREKDYFMQSGIMSSSFENLTVEQVTKTEGVSTIKVFEEASKKCIPIYNINKGNIDLILPKLKVSNAIIQDIKNSVNANKEVVIPEENITLYDWEGTGYIVSDPDTGSAGYMISGGFSGGNSVGDFSLEDWQKIADAFLEGFVDGFVSGIIFSIIAIGIMVLLPELAPVIFLYVGLICGIHLISALSVLWQQLTDSSLPLLQKWIIGARFLGNLLGAILGTAGVMEGFKAAKIRLYRDMINESGLSPEVVEKLNKNAAKNDYVKLIDEASKLSKNGVSDEAICEILDGLTTNNVARLNEVIEEWNTKNPEENLTNSQIAEMIRGVQEGKSTEGILDSVSKPRIYKDGFEEHLIKGTMGKGSKGVVGGHNFEEFKKTLSDAGYDINDCIISITEHPSIKGIYEVEYRIPAKQYGPTGNLEIIPNQYKTIKYPKTVYDSSVISNEQMIQWGKEAMESGVVNGRRIEGYASNGLKFEGFIDLTTDEITNFYPVLE